MHDHVEAGCSQLLDVDAAALATAFGSHALALRHRLAGAPGFTVDDIVALAGQLATTSMQASKAQIPLLTPGGAPAYGDDLTELVRDIGSRDGRVGLLLLHRLPRYRETLTACLGQVLDAVGTPEGPPDRHDTSIFFASPNTTVPVHFDSHHNVLLQLAGTKEVVIGAFAHPDDQARALEVGCRSGTRMADVMPPITARFPLAPGDGLYIPPYTLHWVLGGPDISAALSCSFSTGPTIRAERVHACNAQLRRLGVRPRPPGRSLARDRIKVAAIDGVRRIRRTGG